MHRYSLFTLLIAGSVITAACISLQAQPQPGNAQSAAKAAIRHQVDTYIQSICDADTQLGATVWATTPDSTFIHPLGHEWGWDQIASNVYGKLMGQTFSERTLKAVSDVTIHIYGDAAVVEFDWDFVATLRTTGQPIHTTGRESQVYAKLPAQGWRLVHVHYSGPPLQAPARGITLPPQLPR